MILIKIGGGENINIEYICEDLASLVQEGEEIVLVHGANALRDNVARDLMAPTKIITSPSGIESVYTDKKAIDIFLMTYAGIMNKKIVALLIKNGVQAVGLSGVDGSLFQAKRKKAVYKIENGKTKLVTDNLTGKVEKVNSSLIKLLLKSKYVPVCTAPAISKDGEILNIDNDTALAYLARALKPEKIVSLFEAPGMLKDAQNEKSLIKNIKKERIGDYLSLAKGRMKKKILGLQEALSSGVEVVYWGDGRIKNPVRSALSGKGTTIS